MAYFRRRQVVYKMCLKKLVIPESEKSAQSSAVPCVS